MTKSFENLIRKNEAYGEKINYEAFTFGDLTPGEKYIPFPRPFNDEGESEFMQKQFIYKRIQEISDKGFIYNTKRTADGKKEFAKDSLLVIKVK